MQNKYKILFIAFFIFVVSGLGLWVLNSSKFSNNQTVISIKSFYYLKFLPKIGFDGHYLTYTIFPTKKDPKYGYYTYTLLGKFEKIDFEKNLIYLKDKNGRRYTINIFTKRILSNTAKVGFDYNEYLDKKQSKLHTVEIDIFSRDKAVVPFKTGDNIEIQWFDFQSLDKVLNINSNNEISIVREGPVLEYSTQIINRYIYEN